MPLCQSCENIKELNDFIEKDKRVMCCLDCRTKKTILYNKYNIHDKEEYINLYNSIIVN